MDETKGNDVGTNAERTPFLGDSFGEADDCSLGSSIVGLTNVTMKTRDRRDIDYGTILLVTLIRHEYHNGHTKVVKRHKP